MARPAARLSGRAPGITRIPSSPQYKNAHDEEMLEAATLTESDDYHVAN